MDRSDRIAKREQLNQKPKLDIRPVGAEDEVLLQEMFDRCLQTDIEFRLPGLMQGSADQMANRLTHLDLEREMAFVATTHADPNRICGFAHIVIDGRDGNKAEFDVVVRPDYQGDGLGYELMTTMLRFARQCGLKAVAGTLLRENRTMRWRWNSASRPKRPAAVLAE
jgi:acetyltransferase